MAIKDIVLLKDVPGTGLAGTVKRVAPGFARYLLNSKLAVEATDGAIQQIKDKKSSIEREIAISREKAQEIFDKINGETVTVAVKPGESGKLHEAVTSSKVCELLNEKFGNNSEDSETKFDKRKICLIGADHGIKTFGCHEATVELFADSSTNISAKIFVNVIDAD